MTVPDVMGGNSDAPVTVLPPVAAVPLVGLSEVTHLLVILGAVLASTGLHKDFGLTAHAADYAPLVAALVTTSLGIARALKHRGAMMANATVYAAQLDRVAGIVIGMGSHPTPDQTKANLVALTAGVQALNGGHPEVLAASVPPRYEPWSPAVRIAGSATAQTDAGVQSPTSVDLPPVTAAPVAPVTVAPSASVSDAPLAPVSDAPAVGADSVAVTSTSASSTPEPMSVPMSVPTATAALVAALAAAEAQQPAIVRP